MAPRPPEAERYADAVQALAAAGHAEGRVEAELASLRDLIAGDPRVRAFLADPAVRPEGKGAALAELISDRCSPLARHIILLLHEEGRLPLLGDILDVLAERIAARSGRVTGDAVSAAVLPDDLWRRIEEAAGAALGKQVRLRVRVDPALLGGVRVRVGDWVLDGTVEHHFAELQRSMLSPG